MKEQLLDQPILLSRREIAKRLNRSPMGVNKALKRLDIQPSFTSGTYHYYDESILEKLRNEMRRMNYNQRFS